MGGHHGRRRDLVRFYRSIEHLHRAVRSRVAVGRYLVLIALNHARPHSLTPLELGVHPTSQELALRRRRDTRGFEGGLLVHFGRLPQERR